MGKQKNKKKSSSKSQSSAMVNNLLLGKERETFVENLSMLVAGGTPIMEVLSSAIEESKSSRMKFLVTKIKEEIDSGSTLWKALQNSNLFPEHSISLIRIGEESGRLVENLKVVAIEQEKNREFRSKLQSAMMYPVFVLTLTVFVGVGIAWFILPKLALVFSQLKIKLPLITKILIGSGVFLGDNGVWAIPAFIGIISLFIFFLFSFPKTKFIGQFIVFHIPGINRLMKEVEIARFGFLLGTLLEAGLPITKALDSLSKATSVYYYRKLYSHMKDSVEEGNSVKKSFDSFSGTQKLIPTPIQRLVVAGERSGMLPQTLVKVGSMFEIKADASTKNITVILEPVLLVIVWLGVVAVALAVILPIYNLIGGFNSGISSGGQDTKNTTVQTESSQTVPFVENVATSTPEVIDEPASFLRVLDTGIGYLRVRSLPSISGEVLGQVYPGDEYEYIGENEGWYEILLEDGKNSTGWVAGRYIKTIEN